MDAWTNESEAALDGYVRHKSAGSPKSADSHNFFRNEIQGASPSTTVKLGLSYLGGMGSMTLVGQASPWLALAVVVSSYTFAASWAMGAADGPPGLVKQRVTTLDGLRGFLALAVLVHHVVAGREALVTGVAGAPREQLYAFLGPFGVSLFFMITGYLFWSQLIAKQGNVRWGALYTGRIFRIGPLYLTALGGVVLSSFWLTGFHLRESPDRILSELVSWALPLGFHYGPPINGYEKTKAAIGVLWTLRYEWVFYASLILWARFARNRTASWGLPMLGLGFAFAMMLFPSRTSLFGIAPFVALFSVGMLAAAVRVESAWFKTRSASVAAAAFLGVAFISFRTAYAPLSIIVLGLFFFLVANGVTLFGLFARQAAHRLGNISYGIYLLHPLILVVALHLPGVQALVLGAPGGEWAFAIGVALVVVALATLCHVVIERPGIEMGRSVSSWLTDSLAMGRGSFMPPRAGIQFLRR
jgi:peptidoglycan/LPS O-acetylase OafA/YrhL